MKKLLLLSTLLLVFGSAASAQTKRIAHRSHSGSNATFSMNEGDDNYGLPPGYEKMRMEQQRKNDSIKKANADSAAKAKADSQSKKPAPAPKPKPGPRPKAKIPSKPVTPKAAN